jgi:hypothetical protein
VATICIATSGALAQSFFESGAAGTFVQPAPWATDRFAPGDWTAGATDPLGGTALRLGIRNADRRDLRAPAFNSGFYDTQGRQRAASIVGNWEVGGELFIPQSWLTPGTLRRSDLWSRDNNPVETSARYLIVGFINNDPADGFNPAAANFQPRFRSWDSTVGWTDLVTPVLAGQYNSFKIVNTGSSHDYYINGVLVDSNVGASYSDAGFEDLRTVFLEAFNFGNAGNATSLPDSSYDAHWRNVYAAVPAPGAAALLGLGGLLAARRRR